MERFSDVLLVWDPELRCDAALARAAGVAKRDGARLCVLSVVGEPPPLFDAVVRGNWSGGDLQARMVAERRQRLDGLCADLRAQGIDARAQVSIGVAFLEVIRAVLRSGHDLVVTPAEGRGGLYDLLFGGLSRHLLRKCPCPVWVVKAGSRDRHACILAAIDVGGSEPGRDSLNPAILRLAGRLAAVDDSDLHVIQAWSVFGEGFLEAGSVDAVRERLRREYAGRITALLEDLPVTRARARVHLQRGHPATVITRLVQRLNPDLLVMGTVCRTGVEGMLLGNTAEAVLERVDCSVLTLKPAGFRTPVQLDA